MALFGTDGVRGIANQDLTIDLACRIGQAAADCLPPASRVLIGRDTRVSGPMLEAALTAGLTSLGVEVMTLGVVPTPALAYLIAAMGADAGIMISASHNPPEYNGIKLLDRQGRKWDPVQEQEVERLVLGHFPQAGAHRIGRVLRYEDAAVHQYYRYLTGLFAGRLPTSLRLVVDVAHGAAMATAPAVLRHLGFSPEILFDEPVGELINQACGATHPEAVRDEVLRTGADLGLAFDGDADRLIAVDHTGHIVDGDEILYVLAKGLKSQGKLPGDVVVATVMSNLGFERALDREGIRLVRTPVGDRWVAEAMRDLGARVGGEQSGHIILSEWAATGDGLLTALALLAEIQRQGRPLAELVRSVERYPQILKNVRLLTPVSDWEHLPGLQNTVQEAQRALGQEGRVLIRPSGTEPLLRIMLEGRNLDVIHYWADRLEAVVHHALESAKA